MDSNKKPNRRVLLKEFFEKEGIKYKEHSSHGLYFDVWVDLPAAFVARRSLMIDCSPEDLQPGEDRDLIVVRDNSNHYSSPIRVGTINLHDPESLDKLKNLICA